jgi:hypothetical protein
MSSPEGYRFTARTNGEVAIFHHGKLAKMLKDDAAQEFLAAVKKGDEQKVMGAAVGNDGQAARPGGGPQGLDGGMRGNGAAHGHKEFRRKSGSA